LRLKQTKALGKEFTIYRHSFSSNRIINDWVTSLPIKVLAKNSRYDFNVSATITLQITTDGHH
jgi:hypothetical protein